jgi:hypothetical protein
MTTIALLTRLTRMLEEKMIKEEDMVFWSGVVGDRKIKLPVTGLEVGSQEIQFDSIKSPVGCLQFGRVVP